MWDAARSVERHGGPQGRSVPGPARAGPAPRRSGRRLRRPGGLWTTNEPSTAVGTTRSGATATAHCHRHGRCAVPRPAPRCRPGEAAAPPVPNAVASVRPERTPDERRNQQRARRDHPRSVDDTGPGSGTGRRGRRPVPPAPRSRSRTRRRPRPRPGPPARRLAAGRRRRRSAQRRRGAAGHRRRARPPGRPGGPTPVRCRGAPARSTARRCGPPRGAAGAPPPAASAGGSMTDSPSRAPNRSPTASSMPRVIGSISAKVTPTTPAPASSAPR